MPCLHLVSHYSAIGDTISCDAPYSAIGFRGKLFLRYPLARPVLECNRPLLQKEVGCSSDSLRYYRKHSATGVLLHLSRDRRGISVGSLSACRVASEASPHVQVTREQNNSRTKNQPKEEVFGTDVLRTSGNHSRGYPDPKLRSGRPQILEKQAFGRGYP